MKIKIKNAWLVFKDQLPLRRMWYNYITTNRGYGIFHKNSHIARYNGQQKIGYSSKEKAQVAADKMAKKYPEKQYSAYKCLYCDKFHVGGKPGYKEIT